MGLSRCAVYPALCGGVGSGNALSLEWLIPTLLCALFGDYGWAHLLSSSPLHGGKIEAGVPTPFFFWSAAILRLRPASLLCSPPPRQLPNKSTSRKANNPTNRKAGKLVTQQASNGKREPAPGSFIRRITLTMRNLTRQNLLLALAHPHPAAPLPLLPARSHLPTWRSPLP